MAHFAKIHNNLVTEVIVISNDDAPTEEAGQDFIANKLKLDGEWKQTSYNHNFRKQYAGIGYTYNADADVFVASQPFPSWALDENFDWQPPIPMPVEEGKVFMWFEPNQQWIEVV